MRRTRQTFQFLLLVLVSLSAASCVPSRDPLSDGKSSDPDSRLIGQWQRQTGDEVWNVRKWPGAERTLEAVEVRPAAAHTANDPKRLFTTIKGAQFYLSLEASPPGAAPAHKNYWIGRYEMPDRDTLRVYLLDDKAVAAAVRAGKLNGSVTLTTQAPGKRSTQVEVTETPENLLRAIERNEAKLLVNKQHAIVYKRQK